MTAPLPTVTLIGCGKMGSAMLRGWLAANVVGQVYVIETYGLPEDLDGLPNVKHVYDAPDCDMIVLAVKPQMMDEVCEVLTRGRAAILSIAAGLTIEYFEKYFGEDAPIIRAMPNIPAAIGQGMTVAVTNAQVDDAQVAIADTLMQAMGRVEWVGGEALLDGVTAVSGSGPAYVFYLIEAMAKAGENAGLDPDFAMTLARQTVIGAAALAAADPQTSASDLRVNVTSRGGTTEAALEVLMDGRMQDLFNEAIAVATARSKELAL